MDTMVTQNEGKKRSGYTRKDIGIQVDTQRIFREKMRKDYKKNQFPSFLWSQFSRTRKHETEGQ